MKRFTITFYPSAEPTEGVEISFLLSEVNPARNVGVKSEENARVDSKLRELNIA